MVVAALDRLGRSLLNTLQLLHAFEQARVVVVTLRENVDMATPAAKMIVQVMGAAAELERNLIAARTKAALAHRKALGVRLGRPPHSSVNPETVRSMSRAGQSARSIAGVLGVSRSPINRIIRAERLSATL